MLLHLSHDAVGSPSIYVTVVNLLPVLPIVRSRKVRWERVVSIMTRLDDPAFDFRKKQQNFLFFMMSRQALGPIKPSVQWGPSGEGDLSLGVKWVRREADYPQLSGFFFFRVVGLYSQPFSGL